MRSVSKRSWERRPNETADEHSMFVLWFFDCDRSLPAGEMHALSVRQRWAERAADLEAQLAQPPLHETDQVIAEGANRIMVDLIRNTERDVRVRQRVLAPSEVARLYASRPRGTDEAPDLSGVSDEAIERAWAALG